MAVTIDGNTGGTALTDQSAVRTQKGVPAFSAYQSVAQTIGTLTFTKINLQSEEFDTTGAFDSTTNYRFQPTTAGYYQLNANVQAGSTASLIFPAIYKNGSQFKNGTNTATASSYGASVSAIVYLNGSTDYVEFWAYFGTGQALNATANGTYFQGILIAAA